jgi:hypothetical protein
MNPSEIVKEEINSNTNVDANLSQQKVDANSNQSQPETQEDPNWKAFREARKTDRMQREAAERKAAEKESEVAALKAAMEAAFSRDQRQHQQQNHSTQYHEEETEDERTDKKVSAILAVKEAEYEKQRYEKEQQDFPERLKKNYSDFNQTVSEDNQDYLIYHYPEVAEPIKNMPDGYKKWECIYRAIKKFVPNNETAKKEAARAQANFIKPKSMSGSGLSQQIDKPTSNLNEETKAANWKRMQKTLRGVSN